jgi:glycine/D-amino acid oxidase-like deaminating enzyme
VSDRPLSFWEQVSGIRPAENGALPVRPCDVLIVGAGFSGSWLAYFLKKKQPSLRVTIVERDFFTLGASARNAGFLSCGNVSEWLEDERDLGREEMLCTFEARVQGIEIIRSELGPDVDVDPCGSIDADAITDEKRTLARVLNGVLRDRGMAPIYATRTVRIGGRDVEAFVNGFDGAVNPCQILQSLHARLRRLGVELHFGVTVTAIGAGRAQLSGQGGTTGTIRYERAMLCVNAFAPKLHAGSAIAPARGQVIVTSPCRTDTHRSLGFLDGGYDYFRFVGDRVLVGGGRRRFKAAEGTDRIEATAELRAYLVALAERVIGHAQFTVDFHWAGIMGLQSGGHASISGMRKPLRIDATTEELSSCGGWGVTLSPVVARSIAAGGQ